MSWLRIDLRGTGVPLRRRQDGARARRLALRRLLLDDPGLTGAAALAIARELRPLELREAAESMQRSESLQDLR